MKLGDEIGGGDAGIMRIDRASALRRVLTYEKKSKSVVTIYPEVVIRINQFNIMVFACLFTVLSFASRSR